VLWLALAYSGIRIGITKSTDGDEKDALTLAFRVNWGFIFFFWFESPRFDSHCYNRNSITDFSLTARVASSVDVWY